jgi:hypothetical protein
LLYFVQLSGGCRRDKVDRCLCAFFVRRFTSIIRADTCGSQADERARGGPSGARLLPWAYVTGSPRSVKFVAGDKGHVLVGSPEALWMPQGASSPGCLNTRTPAGAKTPIVAPEHA